MARRRLAEGGPRSPKGADAKVGFKECLERLEKAEVRPVVVALACCCGDQSLLSSDARSRASLMLTCCCDQAVIVAEEDAELACCCGDRLLLWRSHVVVARRLLSPRSRPS